MRKFFGKREVDVDVIQGEDKFALAPSHNQGDLRCNEHQVQYD